MKKIAILGSTGSIGTQALDIIRNNKTLFEAHTLTAYDNDALLIQQAREFIPDTVVIANEEKYDNVKNELSDLPIKVYTGKKSLKEVVKSSEVDIVLSALVGFVGLEPTISAIKSHKKIALANKETLVIAGELVQKIAIENKAEIIPVDSEHSAIFQCLAGEHYNKIEKIILTASGGPFRTLTSEQMLNVSVNDALKHPNWNMGAKITIDSATMINKGFEMIEAKWLFNVDPVDIEIIIQRESIIHSAVQFTDGSIIAQMGIPDMHLPIQYAFSYPYRLTLGKRRLDLLELGTLHFEKPDFYKFPCLALSYEAIQRGGNIPCVLNAANEICNEAFRKKQIKFSDIPDIIEKTMQRFFYIAKPNIEDYISTDLEARKKTQELL